MLVEETWLPNMWWKSGSIRQDGDKRDSRLGGAIIALLIYKWGGFRGIQRATGIGALQFVFALKLKSLELP